MVKFGKVKFDNNYWSKKSDGTWTNSYNFFEVILHDFGAYNVVYIYNVGTMSLVSTDAGKTFTEGELKPNQFKSSNPVYINVIESEMDALLEEKLNPLGKDKIITWEEPMHEVA